MSWQDLWLRLRALVSPRRAEKELEDELSFHLEMEARKHRAAGLEAAAAVRQARREFGGADLAREECRDVRGIALIGNLWRDARFGLRVLRRTPVFTAVAVASLALGIGANTAVFSLLDAVLLRTLPVRQPEELAAMGWSANNGPRHFNFSYSNSGGGGKFGRWHTNVFSWPMVQAVQRSGALAEAIGYSQFIKLNFSANGETRITGGLGVTGNYFTGLGVKMALGRPLVSDDDHEGGMPAAVISYRLWDRAFALDRGVLGRSVYINRSPYVIVGVTAREFFGISVLGFFLTPEVDLTLPIRAREQIDGAKGGWWGPDICWVQMMARIKAGSPGAASARLTPLVLANLPADVARAMRTDEPRVDVTPASHGLDYGRSTFKDPLTILIGVVGLTLLMACANLAGLLLARATSRTREISVRLALGAGRWRLVRQLLIESALLAGAGSAAGLALAWWGVRALLALTAAGRFAVPVEVRLDARILAFTAGVSLLTTVLFGLAPALRATRLSVARGMKEDAPMSSSGGRPAAARVLVAVQIAVALLLTIGATLATRSLANLRQIPLGFNPKQLVLFTLDPGRNGYDEAHTAALFTRLLEQFNRIPGVMAASASAERPMSGLSSNTTVTLGPGVGTQSPKINGVSERFLDSLEIRLVAGRLLEARDMTGAPVAVINQAAARRFFGAAPAVGQGFQWARKPQWVQVVGVVKDAKYDRLKDEPPPTVYVPWTQQPWGTPAQLNFEIKTAGDSGAVLAAIRRMVRGADRLLPLIDVKTMDQMVDQSMEQERLLAWLIGLFGAITLGLACVGLYGMVSYSVAARTREIGVRMALGAGRAAVLGIVMRQVAITALAGLAIGIPAALALTRVMESMLYGLKAHDPGSFATSAVVVTAVVLAAAAAPARRAVRIDPVRALRWE